MSFKYFLLVGLLILLSPTPCVNSASGNYFVVWNVGQGQWATWIHQDFCDHFDAGGEKNPLFKVRHICGLRQNRLYLSHWDLDHISFVGKLRRAVSHLCVAVPPEGSCSPRKMKLLEGLLACPRPLGDIAQLDSSLPATNEKTLGSNEKSHVFWLRHRFLIPGDSPSSQEHLWAAGPDLRRTRFLLLGHHGSRTSTSDFLLTGLPHLQVTVASARLKKYGHPHAEVRARLRARHIPLLLTEDWGNLWFENPL